MSKKSYMITTAISYPNGVPHIGHAYELVATDALARFKRLDGFDVLFATGTDEHGQKMQQTAAKQGISAAEFANRQTPHFIEMARLLNASNDVFIRTTEPRHHQASQAIWEKMLKRGDIYKDSYSGWYSVRDEAYYNEDETTLDENGVRLGGQGTPVEWVEEESYFFRLSAYQDKLLAHYEAHPEFIGPQERRNEVISFVKAGLRDLSISRTTFDWGIKVPNDDKHVMYVWVDALTNYLTITGFPDENSPYYQSHWPVDVHIIGKDILRFHAIYWPAFLMSAGIALPKRVYAHGFLFNKGVKMSKSLGNVISPADLVATYGLDPFRYFFLREVPFGNDGNYSHQAIVARINADLANDLGNLASRSLSMIAKNCEGAVPQPGALTADDEKLLTQAKAMLETCRTFADRQRLHHMLSTIWEVVSETNRYFAAQEPWALKKSDPERMATVLWLTAELIRRIAILLQPFMPDSASKMLDLLSIPHHERDFSSYETALRAGSSMDKPEPVFPRFVEEDKTEQGAA